MYKIKSELKDEYSKTVKGFIQQISIHPFWVMFIWEHTMWKYKKLGGVIHLDPTGKICSKVGKTKVYIHSNSQTYRQTALRAWLDVDTHKIV